MTFVYLLILLFIFGSGLFFLPLYKKKQKLLQLVIWIFLILAVVFLYSLKDFVTETRFFANLVPGSGYSIDGKTVAFKKSDNGHFYINAKINGKTVKFLVDTGATDVVLTQSEAKKIGINTRSLWYTKAYQTANGVIYSAPIVLEMMAIKNLKATNVKASVASGDDMGGSLLGMSFLQNFAFSVKGDELVISETS